ncbi:hypothetical protein I4U23_022974 [Adineta vaga]|nr:hypothetical protein I4U23_022974 [Adineta vaga]
MTDTLSHNRFFDRIKKLNIYDEDEALSLVDQLLSTRIFISLMTISFTTIIIFTSISLQTDTVTVLTPSENTFNDLSNRYSNTLSCVCKQSSIRQDKFISFNPRFHPICTSQFINQSFILSLFDMNVSDYWPFDYRVMAVSQFQLITSYCRHMKQKALDIIEEFGSKYLITTQVLSYDVFNIQNKALINQLKSTTVTNNKYTVDFTWLNIYKNNIYTGLRSNFIIESSPLIVTFRQIIYRVSEGDCMCSTDSFCQFSSGVYNTTERIEAINGNTFQTTNPFAPLMLQLPNILVGCYPYVSLIASSLECFYDQSCIDLIRSYIPQFSLVSPLALSDFPPETFVGTLINELFIESWNEISNFSSYYRVCSPHSCVYSYNRRFNFLYVITTVISLFGGLKMVLYISVPYIVKFIRRIQHIKHRRRERNNVSIDIQLNQNQSFKNRCLQILRQVQQQIMTYNMFPFESQIKDGLCSTRVYILLFSMGIFVLIFYTSISTRIQTVIVRDPSIDDYEQLYKNYPSTLVCSCTQISIEYSSMIDISARFHQVCSSDFVKDDAWFLYPSTVSHGGFYTTYDFRISGMTFFYILQTLCIMANTTVTNELAVFNKTQFIIAQVLPNDKFEIQISSVIQQFEQQTVASFLVLFGLIQTSVQLNQLVTYGNGNTGFQTLSDADDVPAYVILRNNYDNGCSCGINSTCTRSVAFYCNGPYCYGNSTVQDKPIPGFVVSCLSVDSFLLSTLECIYNASCFQMLLDGYPLGLLDISINPRVANVTLLDPTVKSRFPPNTTMDDIVRQLFIEDWTHTISFSSFYKECAPKNCTYSYEERFNKAYIISTTLGIVGGLSVALRILVPLIVKLLRRIYHRFCGSQEQNERRNNFKSSVFISQIRESILKMNVYRKKQRNSTVENIPTIDDIILIQHQHIATRTYIVLFIISILIISFFVAFTSQTYFITVSFPNISTYEQLQNQYPSTITCPCSQIAIPYSQFIFVQPSAYHQICSSGFISFDFIKLLWGIQSPSEYIHNADRKILTAHIRLLSALCSLAKDAVEQKIEIFYTQNFISIETITRYSFQTQMDSLIENLIDQIPVNFRWIHQFIIDTFHGNQLSHRFRLNWLYFTSNERNDYIVRTNPAWYNESGQSCSCLTSSTCSRSLLTSFDTVIQLPGIVFGCLPIFGLRLSTLECFYSSTCLNQLANFISSSKMPDALNISTNTRFDPISSVLIGTLIDELFIETWQSFSNYSNYFTYCAPLTCHYSYEERNSFLYILTTFLGLYGGLTVGLQLFVWHVLSIYWKICQWFTIRHGRVQTVNEF